MLPPFFITFHTYGTRLHGDPKGAVDRNHNAVGTPLIGESVALAGYEFGLLKNGPFELCPRGAQIVQRSIEDVCEHRQWRLRALNVRSTHVHVVVLGGPTPEKVMNDFKAYATRALKREGLVVSDRAVWSRHGSTRWLNTAESIERAIEYVIHMQGKVYAKRDEGG